MVSKGIRTIAVTFLSFAFIYGFRGVTFATDNNHSVLTAAAAPNGADIAWRSVGPGGGGWIESIAWDPNGAHTLYVGCDVGGFYISKDDGRHYERRNTGLKNYFIQDIAVDPNNTHIILLATEGGVYRTTDRGKHWTSIRNGFPPIQRYSFSAPIGCIQFDPVHPNIAFAGVGRPRWGKGGAGEIYRSTDTGLTWRDISTGQLPGDAIVSDIAVKPNDSRIILAATDHGVFRSVDGGNRWTPSDKGLDNIDCQRLAFSPSSPDVVYITVDTTARDNQPWNGGVYRSDNAGETWKPVNGHGMHEQVGKSGDSPYLTDSMMALAVDPRNANIVYAADHDWINAGVLKTTNGGASWREITNSSKNTGNMQYGLIDFWGPSVECMALSPADPNRVAIGTSGHVFVTKNGGLTWDQRYCEMLPGGRFTGTGLETTCPNTVIPSDSYPHKAFYCYADIGLLISDDDGKSFERSYKGMKYAGNCFTVLEDPSRPSTLWAATGWWDHNAGDICMSVDGGATWRVVGDPNTGLPDGQTRYLVLDRRSPVNRRTLVATCEGHGIYESKDGGVSWKCINGNLPAEACRMPRGLLINPSNSNRILIALGGFPEDGSGVYETTDNGVTWSKLNIRNEFADIRCITASPRNFSSLYIGCQESYDQTSKTDYPGGVFKSTDGGESWRLTLSDDTISSVAIDPQNPQTIFAATNDFPYHDDYAAYGLLISKDGGSTWKKENHGLSLLDVNNIAVSSVAPYLLYVSTQGNGVFIGGTQR